MFSPRELIQENSANEENRFIEDISINKEEPESKRRRGNICHLLLIIGNSSLHISISYLTQSLAYSTLQFPYLIINVPPKLRDRGTRGRGDAKGGRVASTPKF
jgi:hypothetical protein